MTAHLQSAARAFEAVMRDLRPEHHWIGEVRPGQLDERAGNSAAAVRGDQAGAVRDHAAAISNGDGSAAADRPDDHHFEQAA